MFLKQENIIKSWQLANSYMGGTQVVLLPTLPDDLQIWRIVQSEGTWLDVGQADNIVSGNIVSVSVGITLAVLSKRPSINGNAVNGKWISVYGSFVIFVNYR